MKQSTIEKCNYCREMTLLEGYSCCEKCNWEMYVNELSQFASLWEKEEEMENRESNPLNNPYLRENYNDYQIIDMFASTKQICEYYNLPYLY